MNSRKWQDNISRAVFMFLFFSMIGWVYEVVLAFIYGYGFVNRGFLFGPYLPLYGSGALLLIVCLQRLMKAKLRIKHLPVTPLAVFAGIIVITTTLEYLVGLFLEVVFDQRFWDYSTYNWQFQGRISVSASVRFGLGGMVFLYLLVPLFSKIIDRIPRRYRFLAAMVIVAGLIVDLVLTLYISSRYGFDPVLAQPK